MLQTHHTLTPGAAPFEQYADRYDNWFDTEKGRVIFQMETDTLRDLLENTARPWLEVGVGTGRFAQALGVDEGIDASAAVLKLAALRGIAVRHGQAGDLPYPNRSFGMVLLIVTICFLNDPARALQECRRILRDDGCLIIGLVPKNSRWGRHYARQATAGHSFYSAARFYTVRESIHLAAKSGFRLERSNSTLFDAPVNRTIEYHPPRTGALETAGFVALRFACH